MYLDHILPLFPLYSPNFIIFQKTQNQENKTTKTETMQKTPPNYNQIKVHKKTGVIRCWSAIEHEAHPGMVENTQCWLLHWKS